MNSNEFRSLPKSQLLRMRDEALQEAQAIHQKAENEKRNLTDQEKKAWEDAVNNFDRARLEIEARNIEEAESRGDQVTTSQLVNLRSNEARGFMDAIQGAYKGGGSASYTWSPERYFKRAMTPLTASAGGVITQSTSPNIYLQATANLAWMRELTTVEARNNSKHPYIKRANRLSAATKGYSDALTASGYITDSHTVDYVNYYAWITVHNDVIRDQADGGNVFAAAQEAARGDILRAAAYDILYASGAANADSGTPKIGGVVNYTDVLTRDASATGGLTNYDEFTLAAKSLMAKNVDTSNISVLMSPGVTQQWANFSDTTGQPLMMPEPLKNWRWYTSSLLPENEGGGSETSVFIGDFSKINLFMDPAVTITLDQRSAEYDWTGFLVVMRADMHLFEPDHLYVLSGITVS